MNTRKEYQHRYYTENKDYFIRKSKRHMRPTRTAGESITETGTGLLRKRNARPSTRYLLKIELMKGYGLCTLLNATVAEK